ncbi:MAG: FkbM family methyltransferase [bacterium]|nr:FkbM family methyltransferase [bacterium]
MMPTLQFARSVRRRWLPPDAAPVRAARTVTRWALACAYPRGVPVHIGNAGEFRILPALAVGSLDYASWGTGKNAGFTAWVVACRGKRAAFDIGAHIGLYAMPASRVLASGGRCYAFEPAAANADALERHCVLNGCANVTVTRALVGATVRDAVPFFEQAVVVGMNSIVVTKHEDRYERMVRPQVTVDAFCAAHDVVPEVVKIDVEGGEIGVLVGARATFARARPRVFLSVHPRHLVALGTSVAALADCIRDLKYRVTDVLGNPADVHHCTEVILEPM